MIQVGLLGSHGRMGKWVMSLLSEDYSSRARIGAEARRGDPLEALFSTDAVIDFSSSEACALLAGEALKWKGELPVFVVGSTGWKSEQIRTLERLAEKTPVLMSSNFSTGVLALQKVLKDFSPLLAKLGYQPVIVETHHQHKKDSPSGTALLLNQTIESAAKIGPIQTHSIRAGEVIGDHEVSFYGPADRLVFSHSAQDRSVFARGAIDVALWLAARRTVLQGSKKILSMETYFSEFLGGSRV